MGFLRYRKIIGSKFKRRSKREFVLSSRRKGVSYPFEVPTREGGRSYYVDRGGVRRIKVSAPRSEKAAKKRSRKRHSEICWFIFSQEDESDGQQRKARNVHPN